MRIGMILDNEINDDIRVKNEISILTKYGWEVVLLCKGKKNYPKTEYHDRLFVHRLFIPKKIYGALTILSQSIPLLNLYWYYHFNKIAKKYNIDAIHAHDMYMYNPARKVANGIKKPFILDLHENYPETVKYYEWTKKWYSKIFYDVFFWSRKEAQILGSADKIIVLSDQYKKELLTKFPQLKSENMVRYSNVPDIAYFDSMKLDDSISKKEGEFIIFYFGVIAKRRGIFTLLEAVKSLSKEFNQIKLLLIGPIDKAEKDEFNEVMQQSEIKDFLIYFPWKDIHLLPSYIAISDVCVSPLVKNKQHESGVANKIFQYMYFRKPQVVSDCRPQQEIILENTCGTVFESGNSEDLAEKLKQYIKQPNLVEEFGTNGYNAVVSKYNTKTEGENLFAIYNDL